MTTLTSKGQVTLPKPIRDYLGLRAGAAVDFELSPSGEVVVRAARRTPSRHHRALTHRGSLATGHSTDELMELLRGYDKDANDPGFRHP